MVGVVFSIAVLGDKELSNWPKERNRDQQAGASDLERLLSFMRTREDPYHYVLDVDGCDNIDDLESRIPQCMEGVDPEEIGISSEKNERIEGLCDEGDA
jgi:hypothetical protein